MFSYLRYFAVISLFLVIIGAVALSMYFEESKKAELLSMTREHSEATVSSFSETTWRRLQPRVAVGDVQALTELTQAAERFFRPQQLAKVTIFSPDVTRLYYGSTGAYVTTDGSTRITLFDLDQAGRGQTVARMLQDVRLTGGPSPSESHQLIQLILPIMGESFSAADREACAAAVTARCHPQALAEIYVDVSDEWAQLQFLQYVIVGTMIGTFAVLIGLLMFTTWRAETIIAKQHEVNLELTAAAAQAEAQSRDKSQFLASISHELRTPLNAIIGFSEIIKNEARHMLEKSYQDYVDDIHASGKHLLSLINDILDYSKAEAGKLQIEWAETDASKVIRNSLRMVMPRAEEAQVTLIEDIPSHHLVIVTDAKKLKQVLLNLLSNAVKFTPAGGEVRCHAWEDVVNKTLVIQVRDTGIGIAPKDISRVMTPFGQVDSTLARKYEGTGLGLPLSKKFVESMEGEFAIESELDVGTMVTITLPRTPKQWTEAIPPLNQEPTDVAPAQPDASA